MSRVSVELVVCVSLALPVHAHRRCGGGGDDVSRLVVVMVSRLPLRRILYLGRPRRTVDVRTDCMMR